MATLPSKVEATIAELVAAFPAAFTLDPACARPLKLGIREDLRAQCAISHARLRAALGHYCNSLSYLKASTEGAVRIDLAGTTAGEVTAKEAASAHRRLTKIAKKAAAAEAAAQITARDTNNDMVTTTSHPAPEILAPESIVPKSPSPKSLAPKRSASKSLAPKSFAPKSVHQEPARESAKFPPMNAKSVAAPPAAAPKPGSRRLGLDDLRRAAQARKTGATV